MSTAARQAIRRPAPQGAVRRTGRFRWFPTVFPFVMAGYLFLGRPFAYLHIPGTPAFVGEILLVIGAVECARALPTLRRLLRTSRPAQALAAFMGFGALLLITDVSEHGLLAIRDSALWYYGAFSFIVATVLLTRPELLSRWSRQYRMVVPAFLLWMPVAVVAVRARPFWIMVPDSPVDVLAFKPGDLAVFAGSALAYLWLVDRQGAQHDGRRVALTVLGSLGLMVAGTQNRGGFLAAGVAIAGALIVSPRRSRLLLVGTGTLVTVLAFAAFLDLRVSLGSRELSVDQLGENLISIVDPDRASRGNLEGTVEWRQRLWSATLDDVIAEAPASGFGFGPNLAARYGFGLLEGLRNPHNSHLSVVARMGLLGAAAWIALWVAWTHRLARMVRRRTYHGPVMASRYAAWCLVTALGFLVNAAFDPSLEGPQAGIWLWAVFGVGLAISSPGWHMPEGSADQRSPGQAPPVTASSAAGASL